MAMASRFFSSFSRDPSLGDSLQRLQREAGRVFQELTGGRLSAATRWAPGPLRTPRLDLHETERELCVEAELPGVKPEDLDVRLDGDLLTIRGEKRQEADAARDNVHIAERSYGHFDRLLRLPFTPDPAGVTARFEQGVLRVRLPKRGYAQGGHRIEVVVAEPSWQPAPPAAAPAPSAPGQAGAGDEVAGTGG
jgi:HSP20 family protein